MGIPWTKVGSGVSRRAKDLEAAMQFGIAGLLEGMTGFVGLQEQLAPQLRAVADAAALAQQLPAAEQVRLQAQAQEARCLRTGVGMLQVDVHGPIVAGPG